jgi:hypothetical protein
MAMACSRLLTVPPLPPGPDFRVPFFFLCIALSTLLLAAGPYFVPPFRDDDLLDVFEDFPEELREDVLEDDFFFVGMRPYSCRLSRVDDPGWMRTQKTHARAHQRAFDCNQSARMSGFSVERVSQSGIARLDCLLCRLKPLHGIRLLNQVNLSGLDLSRARVDV